MRISDWSSDVCSSDLPRAARPRIALGAEARKVEPGAKGAPLARQHDDAKTLPGLEIVDRLGERQPHGRIERGHLVGADQTDVGEAAVSNGDGNAILHRGVFLFPGDRSEGHTTEL